MKKGTKKKKPSASRLIKKLDSVFSQYIRRRAANKDGMVKCFTCPKTLPWKEMQNGHYLSRRHFSTRWLEDNCRPQCIGCNIFQKGNYTTYARRLVRDCGPQILEELEILKNKTVKFSVYDYQMMIDKYEALLEKL